MHVLYEVHIQFGDDCIHKTSLTKWYIILRLNLIIQWFHFNCLFNYISKLDWITKYTCHGLATYFVNNLTLALHINRKNSSRSDLPFISLIYFCCISLINKIHIFIFIWCFNVSTTTEVLIPIHWILYNVNVIQILWIFHNKCLVVRIVSFYC